MGRLIHPTAVIGNRVEIDEQTYVGPGAVIYGPAHLGRGAWVGAHACIGSPAGHRSVALPTDMEAGDVGAGVVIGDRVVIREHVTVEQGTERATRIGDDCLLLPGSIVPHDSLLFARVTLSPRAALAGHVVMGEGATAGMGALIHQRVRVGPGAMVGMGAAVHRDVDPFVTVAGNPARATGVNERALRALAADDSLVALWSDIVIGSALLPEVAPPDLRRVLDEWRVFLGAQPSSAATVAAADEDRPAGQSAVPSDVLASSVRAIVSDVLAEDCSRARDVVRADVPAWDSIKHLQIIMAVEDAFAVDLDDAPLGELDSMAGIIKAVERRQRGG